MEHLPMISGSGSYALNCLDEIWGRDAKFGEPLRTYTPSKLDEAITR